MIKQVQFFGRDEKTGQVFCQPLLDDGLVKTASAESRSKLHPHIQEFVRTVRPTKHGIYVLVNALGAGEYWGSNVNGDYFPEKELIHAPSDWETLNINKMREVGRAWPSGFPTFMGAHPYKHHVNKDPSRAFGSVEIAAWNAKMHRVELVVYLDRELCKKFDAYDIIERIERGEFPDVSMGCKVPYDICSICDHKSKTPKDYCEHAKRMMNKIFPDGRKVCVYNPKPRFFDISFVFIGADKTAKVMAKLASAGNQVCLGSFCAVPRLSAEVGEAFSKEAEYGGAEVPTERQTGDTISNPAQQPQIPGSPIAIFQKRKSHTASVLEAKAIRDRQRETLLPPAALETNNEDNRQHEKVAADKTANDPIKKFIHIQGIPILLEWLKGENRKYFDKKDPTKVVYQKLMKADYGYIPGTKDNDGEQLDVYVGPDRSSEFVFIIEQLKDDGSFDEHKVMIGYTDEARAKKSYFDHMPEKRFGSIRRTTIQEFKKEELAESKAAKKKEAGASCSCHGLGDDCGGTSEKVAYAVFPVPRITEKSASHRKLSEIIKSIPAGPFTKDQLPKLEKSESDIPKETLDRMGEMDLRTALSTPAAMGIVLKPREFQRVMLIHIGERPLADKFDREGICFGPSSEMDSSLDVELGRISHLLKALLATQGMMGERSAASTPMSRRMERMKERLSDPREKTAGQMVLKNDALLQKLSAAYNGYRHNLIKKAALIEKYIVSDPQLVSEAFGTSMAQAFAGGVEKTSSTSVFSPDSLAYLMGAYHQNRDIHTADSGIVESLAQMGAFAEA